MKWTFLLLTFVNALCIGASAQSFQLGGRRWNLAELNGTRVGTPNAYLEFDRDRKRMTGNAGCNRMFGGVEISGSRIEFSAIGTTRMACADAQVQAIETAFLAGLKSIDKFKRSGNALELLDHGRVVMRLVAGQDPTGTSGLEGKKWILESIEGTTVPKVARDAFLVFDKTRSSAGGNSGCNVFGGSYSATEETLEITDVISTMRACIEDERMDVEREYLNSLRKTNRYKIRSDKLMLYRDDRLLLTLTGEAK